MLLVDLQYFAPISLFVTSNSESDVAFYEYDMYRKMTFLNRCLIAGGNNIIALSIPVEGGRQQRTPMKEMKLSAAEPWQKTHWRSLHSAYNRSPFFEHYAAELEAMYAKKQVWLADWNRMCLEWVKEKTGWLPALHFLPVDPMLQTGGISLENKGKPAIIDRRNQLLPKNYKNFPAPVYTQVFSSKRTFEANLSVLDLLFNTGPQCTEYLVAGSQTKDRGDDL